MGRMLHFEDFKAGQIFTTGHYTVTKEEAIGFASAYDPQYFHIDEEAAKDSPFGKLAVSGWHTAAVTMRLKAETDLRFVAGGMVGMGLEKVLWPRPLYPGDTIFVRITVMETRRSRSQPDHGIVKYKVETFNSAGELVMEMQTAIWVPCRDN